MRTIYHAQDLIDAHLALHRLQHAGIAAEVLGGYLSGGIGELPVAGLIRVVVADEDEEAALDLMASAADSSGSDTLPDDGGAEPLPA